MNARFYIWRISRKHSSRATAGIQDIYTHSFHVSRANRHSRLINKCALSKIIMFLSALSGTDMESISGLEVKVVLTLTEVYFSVAWVAVVLCCWGPSTLGRMRTEYKH